MPHGVTKCRLTLLDISTLSATDLTMKDLLYLTSQIQTITMVTPGLDAMDNMSHGGFVCAPAPSLPEIDNDRLTEADNYTETMSDGQRILLPNDIIGVARRHGIWMFKVRFENSAMCPQLFEQLRIGNRPVSDFAKRIANTSDNVLHVEWVPQWIGDVPENLELDRRRFEDLVSADDELLWNAQSSLCIINHDQHACHLCLDPGCERCRPVSDRAKARKAAVDYISLVLEGCSNVDVVGVPDLAEEVLNLAHYDNSVRQYFIHRQC